MIQIPYQKITGTPKLSIQKDKAIQKEYGKYLDEFVEGEIYAHPRGITITKSFALEYATTFHEACPLFLSDEYAKLHGFKDLVVHPLLVFNIVLSLGVQNDSEKAIANLGYYNVCFTKPVYPGDTIRSRTKVLSKSFKGEGKPGIVTVRTIGINQNDELVLQYERKIMVSPAKHSKEIKKNQKSVFFPETENLVMELPDFSLIKNSNSKILEYTSDNTYFEDFEEGQILIHKNMRTITEEHIPWTYRVGNTHPLHYDRLYSSSLTGPMSGEPIVYGGLVFGWLAGLSSRDLTENMLWDFGYTEGYHTQPAIAGDTIGSISLILGKEEGPIPQTGILHILLIGVKNIKTIEALDKYGEDLFIKENDKKELGKEKIPNKIFEIERKVLLKKRPM
ncbi:MAG: MaoC family dehydratase [Leptonema sp. (in: bacteria)]